MSYHSYQSYIHINFKVFFNAQVKSYPKLAASGTVSAFKHLWGDSWGPRLEHFLYHGLSALLDRRQATLIDLATDRSRIFKFP